MLGGKIPPQYAKPLGSANSNPWANIKAKPERRTELVNDLMAMYFAELIERIHALTSVPVAVSVERI